MNGITKNAPGFLFFYYFDFMWQQLETNQSTEMITKIKNKRKNIIVIMIINPLIIILISFQTQSFDINNRKKKLWQQQQ